MLHGPENSTGEISCHYILGSWVAQEEASRPENRKPRGSLNRRYCFCNLLFGISYGVSIPESVQEIWKINLIISFEISGSTFSLFDQHTGQIMKSDWVLFQSKI